MYCYCYQYLICSNFPKMDHFVLWSKIDQKYCKDDQFYNIELYLLGEVS